MNECRVGNCDAEALPDSPYCGKNVYEHIEAQTSDRPWSECYTENMDE